MSHSEFSWQNKNGLNIFAQDWKPEGTVRGAVALVHGLGEHSGRYEHVAAALNPAGYAVTGFDLPGHGRSGGARGHGSYDGTLAEIDRLLAEVRQRYPGAPVFLYGHSLGGALVLYYLLKCQPRIAGAIVTSPGLATGAPVPASKLALAKIMARLAPSFSLDNGLDLNNLSHDPAVAKLYKADPLTHPRISARLGLDLLTLGGWIQAHAGELSIPLLLEQGSQDHLVSPPSTAAFAQAAPKEKVTFKMWEGLYHETHNEVEKAQVLRYMIDWLDLQTA